MRLNVILLILTIGISTPGYTQEWKAKEGHIMSKWAKEVNPETVLPEYPRPQMKREQWVNLNGLWDYAIVKNDLERPENYDGKILVPFAIESALSGVKERVSDKDLVWYRRSFNIPAGWKGKDVLLHFGAVDWETTVYINGIQVGSHQGGYDPFSFDISGALKKSGPQEITISVWDPTSNGTQPRGKQVTKPNGIWYTPVTGIWQTVWLEPVSSQAIASLKITPDIDRETLTVFTKGKRMETTGYLVKLVALDGKKKVATAEGNLNGPLTLKVENPKLWSPDMPFLYDLEVSLTKNGKAIDKVSSYFAMRKISLDKTQDGHERLFLNNKPLFQYGTLDQGWWPGGLYTAPSDEALKYDIEITKRSGFNMIRKHVKVESARWYYHCDQLGMLVWQDMPNGDKSADWRGPSGYDGREMNRSAQSAHQFRKEWKAIIDANYHFPSIVMWVPFNEAWGQFNTVEIINWTMDYDPSRLVNGPSGGNFFPAGHTVDQHQYPGPAMPDVNIHAPNIIEGRALILGEFGGLGLPIKDHLWQKDRNWGYRNYGDKDELIGNYKKLVDRIPDLIRKGLAAAIYTQTTDVEGEVNGLMTYDRAVIKMDVGKTKEISAQLFNQ
ncbi:glycoside hydrolase family 2 TIM barrel-domain containing protein [Fulvivirgaceae bacterium BMA10]|uniref:Glycoside hydrolase family 2 TIM barrel-domain containing protein n=2 Tax=Splendidivirga corallicola TaxID=3051826 RepID=A0ABT8KRS7_9BACT|nr:glycoside hydrolase family 2 TIM barrel-domain containing protein [Fulvivirgaceae bacterium BMA10]